MTNSRKNGGRIPLHAGKTTILVADDDACIRDLCERALRDYRVLQAGTTQEAVRIYKKEPVDLILSDVMMPGGSGIELLKQVKLLDPNAAVIIMTGFAEKEIILEALKEDADDFINKPLNLLQLRTAVDNALSKKALKEELANIKRADQLKSNFLSLISHKLRTPITGISLFLQNIHRGCYDSDNEYFLQNAEMANEEAVYLSRLVADLLTFSRIMIDDDEDQQEECNLNAIASELLIKAREAHGKSAIDIDLNLGELPTLFLYKKKISFALYQIIDNAFKFSGEMGHVGLTTVASGNEVCMIVSDSGVGIHRTEFAKVFEKFYQIDPDNTGQVRGFGLGLFYARDFIRQNNGSITLDSEPGLGTTVTICLPLQ
ncbi:MAG: response regulator [Geobacter sp.]|nr:response regulator [Geobacter sp.]